MPEIGDAMMSGSRPYLALDIGGTWCRAAAITVDGIVISRAAERTRPERTGKEIVDSCTQMLRHVAKECGAAVWGVGVSVTGPVDATTGTLYDPPNATGGLVKLQIRKALSDSLEGVPVFVEKDTNVAALAEHQSGAAMGVANFVYLTISTGIGGAVMIGGKLLGGADGCAGEFGHVSVDTNGPDCTCGRRGCIEAIASGPALAKRYADARARQRGKGSTSHEEGSHSDVVVDGAEVSRLAKNGEEPASGVMRSARKAVASMAVDLANTFNPSLVVIGGSVARGNEEWLANSEAEIRMRALSPARESTRVVASELGDDGGLLGAAFLLARHAKHR